MSDHLRARRVVSRDSDGREVIISSRKRYIDVEVARAADDRTAARYATPDEEGRPIITRSQDYITPARELADVMEQLSPKGLNRVRDFAREVLEQEQNEAKEE